MMKKLVDEASDWFSCRVNGEHVWESELDTMWLIRRVKCSVCGEVGHVDSEPYNDHVEPVKKVRCS